MTCENKECINTIYKLKGEIEKFQTDGYSMYKTIHLFSVDKENKENRIKLLEEENKILLDRVKEHDEIDGGYRTEIIKLKTDYDELRKEYLFYENIILEAIEKNNLSYNNNNDGTTPPNSGNGEGDKTD
jgi:hypothetical protein